MTIEIKVPDLGESVFEATVTAWLKKPGDRVAADEPLFEIDTDKATLEVPAPAAGVLAEILAEEGADVEVGTVVGRLSDAVAKPPATPEAEPDPTPAAPAEPRVGPAARRLIAEHGLEAAAIPGTGRGGRITKGDVVAYLAALEEVPAEPAPAPAAPAPTRAPGREERVRMSRKRRTIAARLKEAQNTAAILTTINEIDMSAVVALRRRYRGPFEERHGVRLGFMSFFVKAVVEALREMPQVNASIDGDDLVYHHYYDIGMAVSTDTGLTVPVLRDCDIKSFAEIERQIVDLAERARDGQLTLDELTGGTFSITNGGVFGSLLSTPILNPPQSAILGLHKIMDRPVVVEGVVEVRPMMYVALSYDHRVVDGRESVTFLIRIKDAIEDPERLMLEI
ncbi:MAG: 2-oxoglutarate dehydrogenase complex dihydrolipoyllysine-residue succinyltransferase [Planctomycetota bacterium]|jgi:2-oxoglutarate dehydrogenase E2 component (dihydrolipoamide succinyltransferase)